MSLYSNTNAFFPKRATNNSLKRPSKTVAKATHGYLELTLAISKI